jgi:hypothetical protein
MEDKVTSLLVESGSFGRGGNAVTGFVLAVKNATRQTGEGNTQTDSSQLTDDGILYEMCQQCHLL